MGSSLCLSKPLSKATEGKILIWWLTYLKCSRLRYKMNKAQTLVLLITNDMLVAKVKFWISGLFCHSSSPSFSKQVYPVSDQFGPEKLTKSPMFPQRIFFMKPFSQWIFLKKILSNFSNSDTGTPNLRYLQILVTIHSQYETLQIWKTLKCGSKERQKFKVLLEFFCLCFFFCWVCVVFTS